MYCKSHDYVLPTIYQGNYNAIARQQEDILFPTLRQLGIKFYAYSPIAGGFLAKSKEQVMGGSGRFQPGSAYWKLYVHPSLLNALDEWGAVAQDAQCGPAEMAYRWVAFNSQLKPDFGDAIIIGANGNEQLSESLGWLQKGPLDEATCSRIDTLWDAVKQDAPLDAFNI